MATTAGYSGTPLWKKLGYKEGTRALALGAPADYTASGLLEGAPPFSLHKRTGTGPYGIVHLFATDLPSLRRRWATAVARIDRDGMIWVSWPKKASGVATSIDDGIVRSHGLSEGLVDVKVCAVDDTWSGLKFVIRRADR